MSASLRPRMRRSISSVSWPSVGAPRQMRPGVALSFGNTPKAQTSRPSVWSVYVTKSSRERK